MSTTTPEVTGFGDPEQDVLLDALAAVAAPAGAVITAAELEAALDEALAMAAGHQAAADDEDLAQVRRYGAAQAAFAAHGVITVFHRLLLGARVPR